jgi:polyisoprenoid-binding protein YceI
MIWNIDPAHSHVSFAIRVLGVTTTRGRFNALRGQLSLDEQNPASSWVEAEVDAASLDTRNRLRDAHLRSAAFLAVKQYPTLVFHSTHVEHVSDQDYKVTGNLTLHGVTKPVTFDVTYPGQQTIIGAPTGLTAKARVNRHDFGLGQGMGLQFAASEIATIEIGLETVSKEKTACKATYQIMQEWLRGRFKSPAILTTGCFFSRKYVRIP